VPDSEHDEEVRGAVVLGADTEATAKELRDHVKAQLAAGKYPRHVWFRDERPKGPTGKILKRESAAPITERT
jgi:long-chain acyl-CoA synthetase